MRQVLFYALAALLIASFADAKPTTNKLNNLQLKNKFIAHEWGTFTSVLGSNGYQLGGLHHEEEELPNFIVGRDLLREVTSIPEGPMKCYKVKGMPVCDSDPAVTGYFVTPEVVTQKMETPVIYFYSEDKKQVKVDVQFPQGIISQYYPSPISYLPSIGKIEGLRNGSVTFEIEITPEKLSLPVVKTGNVYAPAREVPQANYVKSGDQNEKFIFYRGLGRFTTRLNISSTTQDDLILKNSGLKISQVILLDVTSQAGSVKTLGSIAENSTLTLSSQDVLSFRSEKNKLSRIQFESRAQEVIVTALEESGLFHDEALSMFNTWKSSYLKSKGFRALYILSREETDRILPIQINPLPNELVRTLVGRIEIILSSEEQLMLKNLRNNLEIVSKDDRFAEPKLRRLLNLTNDKNELDFINNQIKLLN